MIHMPKGAKVLKDLLSPKEKLEKEASSNKLSEECSAVIQRSLPQKEGDPGSFMLPCLTVKNALADLGEGRLPSFGNGRRRISPDHLGIALPLYRLSCNRRSRRVAKFESQK
ncbi:hypothetical protein Tco_0309608 [Tanacetum coccineum]